MIVWLPTVRLEVLKLAVVVPPVMLSVPWPMLVAPSEKVTTPVGVPVPLTVAVNVTLCPKVAGFAKETTSVLEAALPTVWVTVPLLAWKLPSPTYDAVMVWLPTDKVVVLKLAVVAPPLVVRVPWPTLVAPSENVTTPVGVPVPVTVAEKMTLWPKDVGLTEETTRVFEVALATVCVNVPLLARKFPSLL